MNKKFKKFEILTSKVVAESVEAIEELIKRHDIKKIHHDHFVYQITHKFIDKTRALSGFPKGARRKDIFEDGLPEKQVEIIIRGKNDISIMPGEVLVKGKMLMIDGNHVMIRIPKKNIRGWQGHGGAYRKNKEREKEMTDLLKVGHFETPGCYPGVAHIVNEFEEPICGTRGGFGSLCRIDSENLKPNLIKCKKCLRIIKKEALRQTTSNPPEKNLPKKPFLNETERLYQRMGRNTRWRY